MLQPKIATCIFILWTTKKLLIIYHTKIIQSFLDYYIDDEDLQLI